MRSTLRAASVTIAIFSTCFIIGCAGADKTLSQQNIAKAETAINDARRIEAGTSAPLELRLSEEKLAKAKSAYDDEEYEQAQWLAEESYADATLAEAKARSAGTQKTVRELRDTIETLQQELQRRPPQ
ncbi:MAG: DUF4398 domain-containing protein [Desulfobacterales bacterium]